MGRFLGDALSHNRHHLLELRSAVTGQISSLKSNTQLLQNTIRDESSHLKAVFEPATAAQIKKVNEFKTEVAKINSEQLTTKKFVLNLEAAISHSETEIGFRELRK